MESNTMQGAAAAPVRAPRLRDLGPQATFLHEVGVLWSKRRTILISAVAGAVLALIVALLIPAEYESTTRLMPPDNSQTPNLAALGALIGGTNGSFANLAGMMGGKTSGDLFVAVLRSESVQNSLVDRFDLRRVYRVSTYDLARKKLASRTVATVDRKSGVIEITVGDHDRTRAAQMAQAYVEILDRVVTQLNTSAAHRERVFLEERLKNVKLDLDQAAKDLAEFSSKNKTIDIKEQGKAMVGAAAELQGRFIAAEAELRGLMQIYTPTNVRVRAAQARVDTLRSQLAKIGGGDDAPNAPASKTTPGLDVPTLRQLPLVGVTYTDYYRRAKIQEVLFETLTQQYEMAKVQEAKEIPSIKVLDPAGVPEHRSWPPRLRFVLIGIALAFGASCVWIILRQRWEEWDELDPRKALLVEMASGMRSDLRLRRSTLTR